MCRWVFAASGSINQLMNPPPPSHPLPLPVQSSERDKQIWAVDHHCLCLGEVLLHANSEVAGWHGLAFLRPVSAHQLIKDGGQWAASVISLTQCCYAGHTSRHPAFHKNVCSSFPTAWDGEFHPAGSGVFLLPMVCSVCSISQLVPIELSMFWNAECHWNAFFAWLNSTQSRSKQVQVLPWCLHHAGLFKPLGDLNLLFCTAIAAFSFHPVVVYLVDVWAIVIRNGPNSLE